MKNLKSPSLKDTIGLAPFTDPLNPHLIAYRVLKSGLEICTLRQAYELSVASFRWEVATGKIKKTELQYASDLILARHRDALEQTNYFVDSLGPTAHR